MGAEVGGSLTVHQMWQQQKDSMWSMSASQECESSTSQRAVITVLQPCSADRLVLRQGLKGDSTHMIVSELRR